MSKSYYGRTGKIALVGADVVSQASKAIPVLRDAIAQGGRLTIDISGLRHIDSRFFGLLLMVRKQMHERGGMLEFSGESARIRRAFHLNRFGFLLDRNNVSSVP